MTRHCKNPCGGCALTLGAAANLEPDNNLRAQLAVMGGIPFYCHSNINYGDPSTSSIKRADVRKHGITICQGWRREVKALAATGYYKRAIRGSARWYALYAMETLRALIASERGSEKRANCKEVFAELWGELTTERNKFLRRARGKEAGHVG